MIQNKLNKKHSVTEEVEQKEAKQKKSSTWSTIFNCLYAILNNNEFKKDKEKLLSDVIEETKKTLRSQTNDLPHNELEALIENDLKDLIKFNIQTISHIQKYKNVIRQLKNELLKQIKNNKTSQNS